MSVETKVAGKGWSEHELLSSLLYLIHKNGVTFNWNEGIYPAGRNANGFKQKVNTLKNTLKAEWEAMGASAPAQEATPKKPVTPRKRKPKTDDEGNADADASPKKARGRPQKKAAEPEPKVEEDVDIKAEANGDEDVDAEI